MRFGSRAGLFILVEGRALRLRRKMRVRLLGPANYRLSRLDLAFLPLGSKLDKVEQASEMII